jgi:hypothetical protein
MLVLDLKFLANEKKTFAALHVTRCHLIRINTLQGMKPKVVRFLAPETDTINYPDSVCKMEPDVGSDMSPAGSDRTWSVGWLPELQVHCSSGT